MRHGKLLGVNEPFLHSAVGLVVREYGDFYPEDKGPGVYSTSSQAGRRTFYETLEQGMKILTDLMNQPCQWHFGSADAFKLYDTYGFPLI